MMAFGGVIGQSRAFTDPGIRAIVQHNPQVRARVARVVAVTAIQILKGAKEKAPVGPTMTKSNRHPGGRLKQGLTIVPIGDDGLTVNIGTNVVATIKGRTSKAKRRYLAYGMKNWHFATPRGYSYPARQEVEETFRHTTGEWGYLRKPLRALKPKFVSQCQKAIVRALITPSEAV